jgi:hypothetical protein
MSIEHLAQALGVKTKALRGAKGTVGAIGGALAGGAAGALVPIPGAPLIGGALGSAAGSRVQNAIAGKDEDEKEKGIGGDIGAEAGRHIGEAIEARLRRGKVKAVPTPEATQHIADSYHESMGIEDGHQPGFEEEAELKDLEASDEPNSDAHVNERMRLADRRTTIDGSKGLLTQAKAMEDAAIQAADDFAARMSAPQTGNAPGADRRRLSLSNPTLANSEFGTQAIMPEQAKRSHDKLVQRIQATYESGASGPAATNDFLGRISGTGSRSDAVVRALTKPSPQRESERAQSSAADNGDRKAEKPFAKVSGRQSQGKPAWRPQ